MKNSFPKRDKRQSKNRVLQCQCHVRISCLGKKALHKYVDMHAIYTFICEKLFSKNTIFELGLGTANPFFWGVEWRLSHFGKELCICSIHIISMCLIFICICIWIMYSV